VTALMLVLWSLSLRPIMSLDAFVLRWEIASAIADATDDPAMMRVMMVTANEECQFRRTVVDCREVGDGGRSLGPWQTSFRSAGEQWAICHDVTYAARVALERIRESEAMCGHLPREARLSAYASGNCSVGRDISRRRWMLAGWTL